MQSDKENTVNEKLPENKLQQTINDDKLTEVSQKIQQPKQTSTIQKNQVKQLIQQIKIQKQLYPKQFNTQGLPNVIAKKLQGLVQILNSPVVNISKIKKYLFEGIPDEAAVIREYCWKIVLGYLPQDKKLWKDRIEKQSKTYFQFVKLFLPQQKFKDYPIVLRKDNPQYKKFQQDFNLWQQIQKDTSRTHAQLSFFCTPAPNIMVPFLTSARKQKFRLINGEDDQKYKQFISDKQKQRKSYRYDYMSRILFIYAKLNPKILYVQGMNEILAPIFYLSNSGRSNEVQQAACFFMFNNAISDVIELHIKDLDKSENGIYGKMNQVNQMLVVIEPKVWNRLQKLKIDPFFYCFRWMTLLFAQDFPLFDTLRIWQSIFSSENRLNFMSYIALSIIISVKQVIMQNDFTFVLGYLQNISENVNINQVIKIAFQLAEQFKGYEFTQHAKKNKSAIQKKNKEKEKQKQKSSITNVLTGKVNKFIGQLNKFLD